MSEQLKDGETLEPLGAKPVAQPPTGLKDGETIEPIQRSGNSAAGSSDQEQPASSRFVQGVKRGAINILHSVKEVGSDLISRPTPVFTGEDSMLNKYVLGPAAHEKDRSILEAAAMHASHGAESVGHGLTSMIHTAGEFVPVIGPMVGSLVDRAREGDIAGAVGEGATYALAPKVARGVGAKAIDVIRDVPGVRTLIPSAGGAGRAIGNSPTVGPIIEKAINGVSPPKPVFPGAPLPEHPGIFPGAHLPENPGVFPGAPLPDTPAINLRQANALTRLPATRAIPVAESGEALGAIRTGPAISTATTTPRAISKTLDSTLREAVGNKPIQAGVPIKNQFKPAIPTDVAEGHTGVSSTALKSFKYDAAAKELHVTPSSGNTVVYGEVTPEQAEAFKSAESMGKAWKAIRDNNPLVAKIADGKRIPVKPAVRLRSASPEATPKAINVPAPTEDLTPILQKSLQAIKPAGTSTSIPGGQPSAVPSILEAAKHSLIAMSKKEVSAIGKRRGIDLTGGNDPDGTGAISSKGAAIDAILNDLSPAQVGNPK